MRSVLSSPAFVQPMLPSLALEPPKSDAWLHEIKFDGYRTVLVVDDGEARAFTRNRLDWSDRYRPIVETAGKLRCRSAVIDGEVVAVDDSGRPDFDGMRTAVGLRGRGLVFVAFDLMYRDGKDLRALPLEERRAELRRLMPRSPKSRLQFSEAIAASGPDVFASAERAIVRSSFFAGVGRAHGRLRQAAGHHPQRVGARYRAAEA